MLTDEDVATLMPIITAAAQAAVGAASSSSPQFIPATVVDGGDIGASITVIPDQPTIEGQDQYQIDVQNLTGAYLSPGMRVMVMFDPAQGARALSVVGGAVGFAPGDVIYSSTNTKPLPWLYANGAAFDTAANPQLALLFTSGVLPDLRGRSPVGVADGASGTTRVTAATSLGTVVGLETVTLTTAQMPSHNHTQAAHSHTVYGQSDYGNGANAFGVATMTAVSSNGNKNTTSATPTINSAGGGGSHNNTTPAVAFFPFIYGG